MLATLAPLLRRPRTAAGILLIREKDAFGASVADRHWKPAAARLLAPLLMAAAHSNRPIGQVLRWLARLEATGTIEEIAAILTASRASGADVALDVLLGLQDRDSRYRSSVIATLETALDPWLSRASRTPPPAAVTSAPTGSSRARTPCT
jgi:hypothetical protein